MFQIPSLALRINPRVWEWAVGQHVWNVPPTAPFPHAIKRQNAFANTAPAESPRSPQHSAPGIVGTSTRAVARAFASEPQPKNHLNNLLREVRHWHIHNLWHDSFRHPLLRNHLDHVNDLHVDPWYRNIHDQLNICARPPVLSPVRTLQTTSPATISTMSSLIYGTGTSTICSWICSLMTATARLQQRVEDRVPDAHL